MTCPLSFMTKMGSSFGLESSLVLRRRVNIGHSLLGEVCIGLRDVVRFIFTFLSF